MTKPYSLDRLDEIEPDEILKLTEAGIETTDELLAACRTGSERRHLEAETGISEERLLGWLYVADLLRIRGIGPQFAELLLAAGVENVSDLAEQEPDSLAAEVARVRRALRLSRAAPPGTRIRRWVVEAKGMEPSIQA